MKLAQRLATILVAEELKKMRQEKFLDSQIDLNEDLNVELAKKKEMRQEIMRSLKEQGLKLDVSDQG